MVKRIMTPISDDAAASLRAGDEVLLSGKVYTARDAAHKRMETLLDSEGSLPFDSSGAVIFYVGPSPAKPGRAIGSAGPTTSGRMDRYTPRLLSLGLKGMIGKGSRSAAVKDAIVLHRAVYFAALGGAGALASESIKSVRPVAYEDLGTEALTELTVEDFPLIVVNDIYGGDAYEDGRKRYSV